MSTVHALVFGGGQRGSVRKRMAMLGQKLYVAWGEAGRCLAAPVPRTGLGTTFEKIRGESVNRREARGLWPLSAESSWMVAARAGVGSARGVWIAPLTCRGNWSYIRPA